MPLKLRELSLSCRILSPKKSRGARSRPQSAPAGDAPVDFRAAYKRLSISRMQAPSRSAEGTKDQRSLFECPSNSSNAALHRPGLLHAVFELPQRHYFSFSHPPSRRTKEIYPKDNHAVTNAKRRIGVAIFLLRNGRDLKLKAIRESNSTLDRPAVARSETLPATALSSLPIAESYTQTLCSPNTR